MVLGASVKSVGPFVAVGAEQDAWGSRFVRVPALDDSWKETVRKLIEDSGYVLLVPEDTEGTFWEYGDHCKESVVPISRGLHPHTVPDASRVATRKPFRVQRGALVIVGRDNVRRVTVVARIVRIPMPCMRCSLRKRLNGRNCGFTLTILSLIQTRNDAAERRNLALWNHLAARAWRHGRSRVGYLKNE